MKRLLALLSVLTVFILPLTNCSKKPITINGKVGTVGYTSVGQDRNEIEYHSIEIRSEGKNYDCRFRPADAQSVLGEKLAKDLLVPDPAHETNQLILTDEPLRDKNIAATLADLQMVAQNHFTAKLINLHVQQ